MSWRLNVIATKHLDPAIPTLAFLIEIQRDAGRDGSSQPLKRHAFREHFIQDCESEVHTDILRGGEAQLQTVARWERIQHFASR